MRIILSTWALVTIILSCNPFILAAEDMRLFNIKANEAKAELIKKVEKERAQAKQQAEESKAVILNDRSKLEKAMSDLASRKILLENEISTLNIEQDKLIEEEQQVTLELTQTDQIINELIGIIRINAKDIDALLANNHQTALMKNSPDYLAELTGENNFPEMNGIRRLAETLFEQIEVTGEVTRSMSTIINRDGKTVEAEVLVIGPFSAAYRLDGEVGFLRYLTAGQKFYTLSKLPPQEMQKQIIRYLEGKSGSVPMDITRGAALQQLSHSLSLWEQIEKGGPIVWPILVIFFFGLLIIVERSLFLVRKHFDSERFMGNLSNAALRSNWLECESYCTSSLKKPVPRVIYAGLKSRVLKREELENILQEAILREIPPMERFLSTLGMLAVISPLLGLLGTVTGMIDTFHIITLHGTSDPRLMSGGISEALVTTMLGLGVAIPLMLAQTILNRSVEKEIGTMEEKAVALVNIIHKNRLDTCTV